MDLLHNLAITEMRTSVLYHISRQVLQCLPRAGARTWLSFLNREEATHVLKEIITGCNLSADAIMLMPPDSDGVLSRGYQLQIKSSLQTNDLPCIKTIVEAHKLVIFTEANKDVIVIYRSHSE